MQENCDTNYKLCIRNVQYKALEYSSNYFVIAETNRILSAHPAHPLFLPILFEQ